jgi:hypothetical protein
VPVVPSINTSTTSSLPTVPTTASVSFDNKRHSTGSTITTNPPPALYPAVSPTLSSSVSSASDYDLMNNPMAASKATAAPSHRASMPVTSSVSASNPFDANPFGVSSTNTTSNPFGQATTTPSALSTTSHLSVSSVTNKRLSVRALYDHEAEEEDELNFKAGDAVEVVEKLEGGWWRGSCRGKEGLFPSNYVQNP